VKFCRLNKSNIFVNDINIKPDWVEKPAKFTEFHVKNNKNSLLLNIGESWTYGESLPDVATDLQQYSIESQLKYTFGSLIAQHLNVDFYQYAVPGNCNAYMYMELERILQYLESNFRYNKIYVLCQLTEPSREHAALHNIPSNHGIHSLYHRQKKIKFQDWLVNYDDIFLSIIQSLAKQYKNLEVIVWKNFCKFQNKYHYKKLKIIHENWIACSARTLDHPYEMTAFQSIYTPMLMDL